MMYDLARKKLIDEIGNDNGYKQIIGEYLLLQLEANPSAVGQIVKEGKTIKGAMEAIKAEARKRQKDGCAVLTDDEGFAVVLEYFDIPMAQVAKPAAFTPVSTQEVRKSVDFDVSLDDLLR